MAFKERDKPFRLLMMESLAHRMDLSREDRSKYASWVKGYNGEVEFDSIMEQLKCENLVLNDLYLNVRGKRFQIDTLLITAKNLYIYEVKNFAGEYYYENEKMYFGRTKKEVFDPLYQINHAESALRQLLDQMGYNLGIKKFIVFVNRNFTLFQAPLNSGMVLPGMLTSHFSMINDISDRLNQTHFRFAKEIKPMHMEDFTLHNVPFYEDKLLKKGIICFYCGSFIDCFINNRTCFCKSCNKKELISKTVIRHAQEYKRLFPEQRITTSAIAKWCDHQVAPSRIRYIFNQQLIAKGTGRWRYYEFSS
ncbi:nuclease-related domain-containing protein [Carnobacterium funditum]|uniref:nuclease-related domain-containing protein n=1 Tax=Carnobacterium funditum TaxID=2752 RepID=UPI00068E5F07|nr:nuclease-related domain-containing protein [Carnobacterium funditum]